MRAAVLALLLAGCGGESASECLWLRFPDGPGPIAEQPLTCAAPCDPSRQACEQGAVCESSDGPPSQIPSRPVYTCDWHWARR